MNITRKLFCVQKLLTLPFSCLRVISKQSTAFIHRNKISFICQKAFLSTYNRNFKSESMDLHSVLKIFEELVPPHLSETWDNTGLLLEPSERKTVSTLFFTNDLTECVLQEAIDSKTDLIISYHPPIFAPMKSLRMSNWKDRIVIKCLENSIALYSPHTAADAVKGGVNDWLINCFNLSGCRPILTSHESKPKYSHVLEFTVPHGEDICRLINSLPDAELCEKNIESSFDGQKCRVKVNKTSLNQLVQLLTGNVAASSISNTSLNALPIPTCGMGRIGTITHPISLQQCIEIVKTHLKLVSVRFAQSSSHSLDSMISTVAVCAGSGSSVLKGVEADLYITGEMSHHDLLDANHRNTSVILSEHSNSERGYLEHLTDSLSPKLPGIKLIISSSDRDPIRII